MGLFGKKKIYEVNAAGQFVTTILAEAQHQWPKLEGEIKETFQVTPSCDHPNFEFGLAVIAMQLQALPNLLQPEQARRIRGYVLLCVSSDELGAYPRETIEGYEMYWSKSIKENAPPFYAIGAILAVKLGYYKETEIGKIDQTFLLYLSDKALRCGGHWWKNLIQKYQILPEPR